MAGAPTATCEAILPSASTSTADGVPRLPDDRRLQSHRPVGLDVALGDNEELRSAVWRVGLPRPEVVEHPDAVAAARIPEEEKRIRAAELGELDLLAHSGPTAE